MIKPYGNHAEIAEAEEFDTTTFLGRLPYAGALAGRISLKGGGVCYAWECQPLPLPQAVSHEMLQELIAYQFPDETVLQFSLYADDWLGTFAEQPPSGNRLADLLAASQASLAMANAAGTDVLQGGAATRNHRLIVTLRLPASGIANSEAPLTDLVKDTLASCGMMPRSLDGPELAQLLAGIIAGGDGYYGHVPSLDRILTQRTIINSAPAGDRGHIAVGRRRIASLDFTALPPEPAEMLAAVWCGDLFNPLNNRGQAGTPYLLTMAVIYHRRFAVQSSSNRLTAGSNSQLAALRRGRSMGASNGGTLLVPSLLILGNSTAGTLYDQVVSSCSRLAAAGIGLQKRPAGSPDRVIAALPGGLDHENAERLYRSYRGNPLEIARILPVIAERRLHSCGQLAVGRCGQLVRFSQFQLHGADRNLLVRAASLQSAGQLVRQLIVGQLAAGGSIAWLSETDNDCFSQALGLKCLEPGAVADPLTSLAGQWQPDLEPATAFLIELVLCSESPGGEAAWKCCWWLLRLCLQRAIAADEASIGGVQRQLLHFAAGGQPGPEIAAVGLARQRDYAGAMASALARFAAGGRHRELFAGSRLQSENIYVVTDSHPHRRLQVCARLVEMIYADRRRGGAAPRLLVGNVKNLPFGSNLAGAAMADALLRGGRNCNTGTLLVATGDDGLPGPLCAADFGLKMTLPDLGSQTSLPPLEEIRGYISPGELAGTLTDHIRYLEVLIETGAVSQVIRLLRDRATALVTGDGLAGELGPLLRSGTEPVIALRALLEKQL